MQTLEYRTMEKRAWGSGPWQDEPDKRQWVDEDRYPAMWVHGGLTFSDFCQEGDEEEGICHLVEPGEPDRVWWLGFDCAHGGELVPAMEARRSEHAHLWGRKRETRDEYRDLAYVTAQVASLAAQLARLS